MRRDPYLQHMTLDTGDMRYSPRGEVDDDIVAVLRPIVAAALAGGIVELPRVGDADLRLQMASEGGATMLAQIWAVTPDGEDRSVVSFGVAMTARAGTPHWRRLHATALTPLATDGLSPPAAPWLAARLEPGAASLSARDLMMLGDLERCLAWAWIESQEK